MQNANDLVFPILYKDQQTDKSGLSNRYYMHAHVSDQKAQAVLSKWIPKIVL